RSALETAVIERQRSSVLAVIPPGFAVIVGLGVLYLFAPPFEPGLPIAISSFVTAGLLAVLGAAIRLAPLGWMPALFLAGGLLAQGYALSFLAFTGDPAQSVVLMVTLIAAGGGLQ